MGRFASKVRYGLLERQLKLVIPPSRFAADKGSIHTYTCACTSPSRSVYICVDRLLGGGGPPVGCSEGFPGRDNKWAKPKWEESDLSGILLR